MNRLLVFLTILTLTWSKVTAQIQSNIYIEENFDDTSPLSNFHGTEFGTPHAFSVVPNPANPVNKVARLELRDTDPIVSNGTRAEMNVIKDRMQKEMWFSFDVYLPASDYAKDTQDELICQWHQSGGTSPPSGLLIKNDRWSFMVRNKTTVKPTKYDLGLVVKDTWHNFTFHYINSNGPDGLIEVWLNGKKVLNHTGGNMYALDNFPKWKVGIYKWEWNGTATTDVSKRVLYYDNIRVGVSRASLTEMVKGSASTLTTSTVRTTATATPTPTQTAPVTTVTVTTTVPTTSTTVPATTTTTTAPTTTTTTVVTAPATTPLPATAATLTFINAGTNKDIKPATNGSTISISTIGSNKISIRANFPQTTVKSARFVLTGPIEHTFFDRLAPFALFGDDAKGNYFYGQFLAAGSYTLTVVPYPDVKGLGLPGSPTTIRFTIAR